MWKALGREITALQACVCFSDLCIVCRIGDLCKAQWQHVWPLCLKHHFTGRHDKSRCMISTSNYSLEEIYIRLALERTKEFSHFSIKYKSFTAHLKNVHLNLKTSFCVPLSISFSAAFDTNLIFSPGLLSSVWFFTPNSLILSLKLFHLLYLIFP